MAAPSGPALPPPACGGDGRPEFPHPVQFDGEQVQAFIESYERRFNLEGL